MDRGAASPCSGSIRRDLGNGAAMGRFRRELPLRPAVVRRFGISDSIDRAAPRRARGKPSNSSTEVDMNARRNLLLLAILAAVAGPASGQQAAPAAGQAEIAVQSAASIPDLSGIWRHGSLLWFVPPA